MKKLSILLMLSLFGALSVYSGKKISNVEIAIVEKSDLARSVKLIGQVLPVKETVLKAEQSGILEQVLVTSGSNVEKNQLLMRINSVNQQKELNLAKQNAQLVKKYFERIKKLVLTADASKQDLEVAQKTYLNAKLSLQKATIALGKTVIKSPISGICGQLEVSQGAFLDVGKPLLKIVDTSQNYLKLYVPGSLLSKLKIGAEVKVQNGVGKLKSVTRFVDSKTKMGFAHVALPESSNLIAGVTAYGEIEIECLRQVITIPNETVFLQDGKKFVYVLNKESKVKLTPVKTGLRVGENLQILSGLKVNEKIILRGHNYLSDGLKVQVVA